MKIGLIIAMDKEMTGIMNVVRDIEQLTTNSAYPVYRARYADKTLYIARSGAGEIASATTTQFLITAYDVDFVLNFGICGKLRPDFELLQTVVISSVVHYQFDLSGIDNVKPGVYCDYADEFIPTPNASIELVAKVAPELKRAVCASGDKFIATKEDRLDLFERFGAEVCEMESAGVLITCNRNSVPCLLIKTISDDDSSMSYEKFSTIAAEKHTQLIEELLKNL